MSTQNLLFERQINCHNYAIKCRQMSTRSGGGNDLGLVCLSVDLSQCFCCGLVLSMLQLPNKQSKSDTIISFWGYSSKATVIVCFSSDTNLVGCHKSKKMYCFSNSTPPPKPPPNDQGPPPYDQNLHHMTKILHHMTQLFYNIMKKQVTLDGATNIFQIVLHLKILRLSFIYQKTRFSSIGTKIEAVFHLPMFEVVFNI